MCVLKICVFAVDDARRLAAFSWIPHDWSALASRSMRAPRLYGMTVRSAFSRYPNDWSVLGEQVYEGTKSLGW